MSLLRKQMNHLGSQVIEFKGRMEHVLRWKLGLMSCSILHILFLPGFELLSIFLSVLQSLHRPDQLAIFRNEFGLREWIAEAVRYICTRLRMINLAAESEIVENAGSLFAKKPRIARRALTSPMKKPHLKARKSVCCKYLIIETSA